MWRIVHNGNGQVYAGMTSKRDRAIWSDNPQCAWRFDESKARIAMLLLRMGGHDVRKEEA